MLAYIRKRKAENIANATINRELDIIRGVLKKAKRWHLFSDEIKPLPVREKIGRALTFEEKMRLLVMASSRPDWLAAYCAAVLAFNTTARGCELKVTVKGGPLARCEPARLDHDDTAEQDRRR
ncbi:MAG: hypothetical protein JOZ14_06455 [Acidobacteria bacterium]|nr:hypothetical protein [Acidobacteriota bacterium]